MGLLDDRIGDGRVILVPHESARQRALRRSQYVAVRVVSVRVRDPVLGSVEVVVGAKDLTGPAVDEHPPDPERVGA